MKYQTYILFGAPGSGKGTQAALLAHDLDLGVSGNVKRIPKGKTAADGSCYVSFMVPAFPNGTAAAGVVATAIAFGLAEATLWWSIDSEQPTSIT